MCDTILRGQTISAECDFVGARRCRAPNWAAARAAPTLFEFLGSAC